MAIQQQWEYPTSVRRPMQPPCSCGCHDYSPAIHPISAAPHRPVGDLIGSPGQRANRGRRAFADSLAVRCAKSIVVTLVAILFLADVGVNAAHNAGALASRIIPMMQHRPFYFDPLALMHDLEKVAH